MKLNVSDSKGKKLGEFELNEGLLEFEKGSGSVHQAVVAYMANQRNGTACTKTRGEVAGSNAKPWKQKGTGRARAGEKRSPIWRKGGTVFGPKPRSYQKSMNRKMARLAFRRAFSDKVAAGGVEILESLPLSSGKTRELAAVISGMKLQKGGVFVVDRVDENLALASRNIPNVEVTTPSRISTYEILKFAKVVVLKSAMPAIEARLK